MDPITQKDVANSILNARSEEGTTFLIVSHDIEFVKIVCDRIAFMKEGHILGIGELSEIIHNFYDVEREKIEN